MRAGPWSNLATAASRWRTPRSISPSRARSARASSRRCWSLSSLASSSPSSSSSSWARSWSRSGFKRSLSRSDTSIDRVPTRVGRFRLWSWRISAVIPWNFDSWVL